MAWVATAVTAVGIGASYLQGQEAKKEARKGRQAQQAAAQAGIDEQRAQFEIMMEKMSPYIKSGEVAMDAQRALIGLGGKKDFFGRYIQTPEQAQAEAIAQIEQSPLLQAKIRQGEEAMLQQAAATGGLRGGNIQGALAQFRPAMLQEEIDRQYQRLQGMAGLGQASAAGVGAAAQDVGRGISGLYGDIGSAQAGQALARGQAQSQLYGDIAGGIGWLGGKKGWF